MDNISTESILNIFLLLIVFTLLYMNPYKPKLRKLVNWWKEKLFKIGILILSAGLVILRKEIIIEGLTKLTHPVFGLILVLVGFYIVIWSAVQKFFKKKPKPSFQQQPKR